MSRLCVHCSSAFFSFPCFPCLRCTEGSS
jgi:hypothetical protein